MAGKGDQTRSHFDRGTLPSRTGRIGESPDVHPEMAHDVGLRTATEPQVTPVPARLVGEWV